MRLIQLPANHLAAGQPPAKLKEDLFSTANSIELFKEMLAPISADDAADVKQVRWSARLLKQHKRDGLTLQVSLASPVVLCSRAPRGDC